MSAAGPAIPPVRARGGVALVVAIIVVVLLEFLLLRAVYHRGSGLERQLVTQAGLAGQLAGGAADAAGVTGAALATLDEQGADEGATAGVAAALDRLSSGPADPEALSSLRAEVDALGSDLTERHDAIDDQASLVYVGLLVVASVGWYVYFRRLVRRHRRLQHALTAEQTTVAARDELATELARKAFRDDLTGLATRQLFSDRLRALLEEEAGQHAVIVVDLDDFKDVNDSTGHSVGDRLLAAVGDRLAAARRPGDLAARLGGDEFAVLLLHVCADEALAVAREVKQAMTAPVVVDGVTWSVQASVGVADAVCGRDTHEEVLRNADIAMYWAKDHGKATVAVYDPFMHAEALDRATLLADLAAALDHDQLVLHYQPTYDLATARVTGFEALVRWQHPERGLLGPLRFVPLAEQTGLILPLGAWVLREACQAAATVLCADPDSPVTMAVNVSARQLAMATFATDVLAVLAETGLPPDRLVVEITESTVVQDGAEAHGRLQLLRRHGVRVAIDDFGTGYSSLSVLSDLPVDIVKIDKSFVDRVTDDAHSASVTEAVLVMTRALEIATVAEGVERADQASWLNAMQCRTGQGYLWAKPMPLDEARRMLTTTPRPPSQQRTVDGLGAVPAGA